MEPPVPSAISGAAPRPVVPARDAVAAERARVARELHDVVAHSVSVIAIQAGAAEALLDLDQPARAHVQAVRRTAHEALEELRRLVGMLREEVVPYDPAPGLAQLADLLEEVRCAGVPVALELDAARAPLPAGLELAIYRIVQESLANVRRHAGGTAEATVAVRVGPGTVELEVVNGPSTAAASPGEALAPSARGDGQGVIGMRERARLYGGTLDAGATADGGYRVRARLPLGPGR